MTTIKSSLEDIREIDIKFDFFDQLDRHINTGQLTTILTAKENILRNKSKVDSDLDIIPTVISITTKSFS